MPQEFELVLNADDLRLIVQSPVGPMMDIPLRMAPVISAKNENLMVFSYNELDENGAATGNRLYANITAHRIDPPWQPSLSTLGNPNAG